MDLALSWIRNWTVLGMRIKEQGKWPKFPVFQKDFFTYVGIFLDLYLHKVYCSFKIQLLVMAFDQIPDTDLDLH
jgi:hypothetical protein